MTAWKRTFVSAFIAQICSITGFSFAMPFLPFYIKDLGVTDPKMQTFWAGLCLGAAGVTFSLFSPVWGNLAYRHGRKIMVVRSMFGGTLVLVLMSIVQSPWQLLACRFLQGCLTGTVPASVALVASVAPPRRTGFALGMMNSAVFIGAAGGPLVGGIVADAFGYRNAFLCGAVVMTVGALVALFGTREEFQRPAGSKPSLPLKRIMLLPGFLAAVMVMLAVRLSNSIANPAFPLIVREIHANLKTLNTVTGGIVAVAAVAGAVSSAVLGLLGDRHGHKRILIGCCLGAAVASFAHAFATTVPQLVVLRILFGLTVAGMLPAANAVISHATPSDSIGKAFGWATSISTLGFAFGPALGGYIGMVAGLRKPFIVTAVCQLLLLVVVFVYMSDRHSSSDEEDPSDARAA